MRRVRDRAGKTAQSRAGKPWAADMMGKTAQSRAGKPWAADMMARLAAVLFAMILAAIFAVTFSPVTESAISAVSSISPACAAEKSGAACAPEGSGVWNTSVAWAAERDSGQKMPEDTITNEVLEISIADLEEADEYLNEQTVQVVGEVVGDRINAEWSDDHYWLTLESRDDSDAEVSLFVDEDMSTLVDTYGVYGKTGTVLQVTGTFNLACVEHEGLSDLHAEKVEVVSQGEEVAEEPNTALFIPGVILVVIGLILVFVFYRLREGQR